MSRRAVLLAPLWLPLAGAIGCGDPGPGPQWRHGGDSLDVLVFTRTEGFTHASIPDGLNALDELGAERGWQVQATDDPAAFEPGNLAGFDVIVFLSTTGDVLDPPEQAALEGYVQAGGGWVGVHSASDTEYDWPWYGGLVGAYFVGHPAPQEATLHVVDPTHPSTATLPEPWVRFDEWYNFDMVPQPVDVLVTIDESTYDGGTMGRLHPMAWAHAYDGGRAWYTAGGHTSESYAEPAFREHLAGGIEWAGADEPAGGTSTGGGLTTQGPPVDSSDGSPPGPDDSGNGSGGGVGETNGGPGPGSSSSAPGGSDDTGGDAPPQDDGSGCRLGGRGAAAWWWLLPWVAIRRRSSRSPA